MDKWQALRDQIDHSTAVRMPDITEVRVLLAERDALAIEVQQLTAQRDGAKRELDTANETIVQHQLRAKVSEQGGDDLYVEGLRKALGGVPDGSAESLARWLDYHAGGFGFGRGPFPRQLKKSADMIRSLSAEVQALRTAGRAFLAKYDALMPAVNAAFVFQHVHGGEYKGDTWGHEIDALREDIEKDKGG